MSEQNNQKKPKSGIQPTREENYPTWYQEVIKAADLAESSPVRGCMVIKPWGMALWENIRDELDKRFKETGHVNAYFPLLIPVSYLEKEATHVDGFAKECAVITHHRLEDDGEGGLKPGGKLEEPLVIRPTSETIIGEMYSKWVQSYRDLPILINQWANVVRWEMRTRLFLRTTEFLWQEGHTVHATKEEAIEETEKMHQVYQDFAHDFMAIPVIGGEKTPDERFPGAVQTHTIEAMMQDRKALQAGTSHFLGQNFAKASNIEFTDEDGELKTAWTTSWGVSTRLIGGLIMTHSDDDGLVLPPKIAPQHVMICPMIKKNADSSELIDYCNKIKADLEKQSYNNVPVRVDVDTRAIKGGGKLWKYIKQGVPICIEIGNRDIKNDSVFVCYRDKGPGAKASLSRQEFIDSTVSELERIQTTLLSRATEHRDQHSKEISSLEEFQEYFKKDPKAGFAYCYFDIAHDIESLCKKLKVSARCIPESTKADRGPCIFGGKNPGHKVIFAKSY